MTLEDRIKAHLDDSSQLDATTQARLQAIRHAALNQPSKLNWFTVKSWTPATSLAFCAVIAILAILPTRQATNQSTAQIEQTAMFELIENPDDLDAIIDPDFLMWIEAQHDAI
jgi:hypothetical protein